MTAKPKDQIIDIFTVEPALDQEVSGTASLDELESVIARNIRSFLQSRNCAYCDKEKKTVSRTWIQDL